MNKINEHNYEAFYLDYLEGNLNQEQTIEFLRFLEQYPQYTIDLGQEGLPILDMDDSPSYDKTNLYKRIDKSNVEDYIIESIEDVIEQEDAEELQVYLSKSIEARKLEERYRKTILLPPEIVFPNKSQLKQRSIKAAFIIPVLAVAATIALLMLLTQPVANNKPQVILGSKQENNTTISDQPLDTVRMNYVETVGLVARKPVEEKPKEKKINRAIAKTRTEVKNQDNIGVNKEPVIVYQEINLKKLEPLTINEIKNKPQPTELIPITKANSGIGANTEIAEVSPNSRSDNKKGLNLWKIVSIGVNGFNLLNERDIQFEPDFTASGSVRSVTIKTEQLQITTPSI